MDRYDRDPYWREGPAGQRSFDRRFAEGRSGREVQDPYTQFWMVPGPHAGKGPVGYERTVERMKDDVCERLHHHGLIDASGIEVAVENAEVTLRGTVDSRETKRRAEDVAESVPGVVDVHNQLRIAPERRRPPGTMKEERVVPEDQHPRRT